MPRRDPHSRLPWLIGAGIVVVLIIAVGGYLLGRAGQTPTAATSTAAPPTSRQTADAPPPNTATGGASDDDSDAAPSGCLGGQDRTVATVLEAQKQASHTAFGAVDFAATYFRWGYRYPYPSASEVRQLGNVYDREHAVVLQQSAIKAYGGRYRVPSGGGVKDGTAYYLSMASGVWTVAEESSRDRVTVSVEGNYVIENEFNPTRSAGVTATLVWQSGAWHVDSLAQPNLTKLASGGTSFTAGC